MIGLFFLNPIARAENKVNVVTTIMPAAFFIEKIGREKTDVTVMIPPGGNPHTYEPTPSQIKVLSRADLYVKMGSGIEFELLWMDKLTALNRKMRICDAAEGVTLKRMKEHEHEDGKEEGHRNNELKDPHIWLSPNNAIIMAGNIRDALIKIDRENKDFYEQNTLYLISDLEALIKEVRSRLKYLKNRKFLVLHPAWGYFAEDFGLLQVPVEYSGKEPTPKRLNNLIRTARKENINVIFVSPQYSRKSAEIIAGEIKGELLVIDPLSKDYLNNLREVTRTLAGNIK